MSASTRYDEIISKWPFELAAAWDEDEYAGSSVCVFINGRRFGLLFYSWGSCAGCDAYQACDDEKAIVELSESMQKEIKWFDSKELMVEALQAMGKGEDIWMSESAAAEGFASILQQLSIR